MMTEKWYFTTDGEDMVDTIMVGSVLEDGVLALILIYTCTSRALRVSG
jgi:hypothetical protein